MSKKHIKRVVCVITVLLILFCSCDNKVSKKDIGYLMQSNTKNHEIGVTESIIEYGDNIAIGAHFPKTGKQKIDSHIRARVNTIIGEFKEDVKKLTEKYEKTEEISELNIDYESYVQANSMCSIVLKIIQNKLFNAHPDSRTETMTFSIEKEELLNLSDVFKNDYLKSFSEKTYLSIKSNKKYDGLYEEEALKEGTAPSEKSFQNFYFKQNKLIIIFRRYQFLPGYLDEPVVEISLEDLKGYLRFKNEENTQKPDEEDPQPIIKPERIIDKSKPMVALTFDDGPHGVYTKRILDALEKHNGAATFFVLGQRVSSNTEIIRRILAQGSELGNHTYTHRQLTRLSKQELDTEINETQNAIYLATKTYPTLMRPTYGEINDFVYVSVNMPVIMWSIDTLDWKFKDSNKIYNQTISAVRDGDVILMHDIYESTAVAAERLIATLSEKGYQLVTISELSEAREAKLVMGHSYREFLKK